MIMSRGSTHNEPGEAGGAGLDAEISLGFSSMGKYFS
jgi:hypothetical protein